jgi:hypothetical protein
MLKFKMNDVDSLIFLFNSINSFLFSFLKSFFSVGLSVIGSVSMLLIDCFLSRVIVVKKHVFFA